MSCLGRIMRRKEMMQKLPTKVRIVGSKDNCKKVLTVLQHFFEMEKPRKYNKAPTRYSRTTRADYSIYVTIKREIREDELIGKAKNQT